MSYRIHKQILVPGQQQEVLMPDHADIKSVGVDGNSNLCVWYGFNENFYRKNKRNFYVAATGAPFTIAPEFLDFLGTVTMPNGLVWHVHEVLDEPTRKGA